MVVEIRPCSNSRHDDIFLGTKSCSLLTCKHGNVMACTCKLLSLLHGAPMRRSRRPRRCMRTTHRRTAAATAAPLQRRLRRTTPRAARPSEVLEDGALIYSMELLQALSYEDVLAP